MHHESLLQEAIDRGLIIENEDGSLSMTPELETEMPRLYEAFRMAQKAEVEKAISGLWAKGFIEPQGVKDGEIVWQITKRGEQFEALRNRNGQG